MFRKKNYFLLYIIMILSSLPAGHVNADEILDFKLPFFENQESFELSKALKSGPVVLNFFASWCTSCIKELPELNLMKEKYKEQFQFIAVNAGEKKNVLQKFLRRYPFNYTILWDQNRKISKSLGVESLPMTIVIAPDRKILYSGVKPPKNLEFNKL